MRVCRSALFGAAMLGVVFLSPSVSADERDRVPQSVTVAFGAGLNTAQPGNSLNHHILPRVITVRTRLATENREAVPGVVNFIVGGFHQIYVYNRGVKLQDVQAFAKTVPFIPPTTNLFLNYMPDALLYEGINPGGANPIGPAVSPTLSGVMNRIEQVGFTEPGLYLVICNVNPHFTDGMIAWVRVVANDNDWDGERGERDGERDEHGGHN